MSAQPETLFNPDDYWVWLQPELPLDEQPVDLELSPMQLGWDNRDRGRNSEVAFHWKVQEIGGFVSDPPEDPGGGTASDLWVKFPGWERPITVQVRGSRLRADGNVTFNLGKKEGSQAGSEQRRHGRYYGRANLFALAVWEDDEITHWYLIPAAKLRTRVTLTVTPGKRSNRRRRDWLEPESYRDDWLRLADETFTAALQGTRTT